MAPDEVQRRADYWRQEDQRRYERQRPKETDRRVAEMETASAVLNEYRERMREAGCEVVVVHASDRKSPVRCVIEVYNEWGELAMEAGGSSLSEALSLAMERPYWRGG